MGCIAIQLLCPRHGQAERADAGAQRREGRAAGACGTGARLGRWACGLGVLQANRLCTWCTQPIFDPV